MLKHLVKLQELFVKKVTGFQPALLVVLQENINVYG